jgi:hypothetical protein
MNTTIDELLLLAGKQALKIFQLEQELRAKEIELAILREEKAK